MDDDNDDDKKRLKSKALYTSVLKSGWSKDALYSGEPVFLSKEALDSTYTKRKTIDRKSSPTADSCSNISDVDPPSMPPSPPPMDELVDESRALQKSPDPIKNKGKRDGQVFIASPQVPAKPYSHIKSKVGSLIPSSNYKKPPKATKGSTVSFAESAPSPEHSPKNTQSTMPFGQGNSRRSSNTPEHSPTNLPTGNSTTRKSSLTGTTSQERSNPISDAPKRSLLPHGSHINTKWSKIDFQDFDTTGDISGVENSQHERETNTSPVTSIAPLASPINEEYELNGRRKSDTIRSREPPVAISPPAKGSSRVLPHLHQIPSWSKIDFPAVLNEFQAPSDTVATSSPEKSENEPTSSKHLHETPDLVIQNSIANNQEASNTQIQPFSQDSQDFNTFKLEPISSENKPDIKNSAIKVYVEEESDEPLKGNFSRKKSLSQSSISSLGNRVHHEAHKKDKDVFDSSLTSASNVDVSKLEEHNPPQKSLTSASSSRQIRALSPAALIDPKELAEEAKKRASNSSRNRARSPLVNLINPKELADKAKTLKNRYERTQVTSMPSTRILHSASQRLKIGDQSAKGSTDGLPKNKIAAKKPVNQPFQEIMENSESVYRSGAKIPAKKPVDEPSKDTIETQSYNIDPEFIRKPNITLIIQGEAKRCVEDAINKFNKDLIHDVTDKIDFLYSKVKQIEADNSRIHQDWDAGVAKMFSTRLHNLEQSVINLTSTVKEYSATEISFRKTVQSFERNVEKIEARVDILEKSLQEALRTINEKFKTFKDCQGPQYIQNPVNIEDEISKLKVEMKAKVDTATLKQLAKHIASIDDVKLFMERTKKHIKKSAHGLENSLYEKLNNDKNQKNPWLNLLRGLVDASVEKYAHSGLGLAETNSKRSPFTSNIVNDVMEGNIKRDMKTWLEMELKSILHSSKERYAEIIEISKKQIDNYLKEQGDLMQQKHENYLQDQATFNPIMQQLKREYDEKLFVLCSDISSCKNLFTKQFHTPFYRCGQWVWHSGLLKLKSGIPWNTQTSNTDPDNFKWTKDHMNIRIEESGIYQISLAFFTKSKPSIQLVVNGNSILSALHSPSYVVHHPGYAVHDGMDNGSVTGVSLIVNSRNPGLSISSEPFDNINSLPWSETHHESWVLGYS